jgi:Ca2+-binding RTX toxin-like protein
VLVGGSGNDNLAGGAGVDIRHGGSGTDTANCETRYDVPEAAGYPIPLYRHKRAHRGVAVQKGKAWLFRCGDARPLDAKFDVTPAGLNRLVLGPHGPQLRAIAREHPEARLVAGRMRRSFCEARPAVCVAGHRGHAARCLQSGNPRQGPDSGKDNS